jgi:hypothetical protein
MFISFVMKIRKFVCFDEIHYCNRAVRTDAAHATLRKAFNQGDAYKMFFPVSVYFAGWSDRCYQAPRRRPPSLIGRLHIHGIQRSLLDVIFSKAATHCVITCWFPIGLANIVLIPPST